MKPRHPEERSDFSAGLNIAAPRNTLNANELAKCFNVRVDPFGGLIRRVGSRKLNSTALTGGEGVVGVKQWIPDGYDYPFGQLVAICGGNLHWSDSPYSTFTTVAGSGGMTSSADFATFRDSSGGAPLVMFIVGNGHAYKWTGSALSKIDGVQSVPDASCVRAFGTRLFMNDIDNPKNLYWSKIGIGDDFRTGGVSDGGSALVDTFGGDEISALETLGSSLLICTGDSISRFSGTGEDIQIAQNSFGITNEVGPLMNPSASSASQSLVAVEQIAMIYTPRGAYAATEAGVLSIGDKINNPTQTGLRMDTAARVIAGHNRRRNEIWFAYRAINDVETDNRNVIVYNYRLQCWYGPFRFPFGIRCMGIWADAQGLESIMAGCTDGFVRVLDDVEGAGSLDDSTQDFECEVEFAPFGLNVGPYTKKALEHVYLQVLGNGTFTVTASDGIGNNDRLALIA